LPNVARVIWVAVTGVAFTLEGVLASAAPTTTARRARTVAPTVTSKVALLIIYPFSLPQSSLSVVKGRYHFSVAINGRIVADV
jgi:hypothetical protein